MSDTTAPSAVETPDATSDAATTAPQVTPADLATAAQETDPDTSTTGQEPDAGSDNGQTIEDLQKQIADLRKEAGKYRTRAKDTEAAKATEIDDLKQTLGKALGLIKDEEPAPDDLIAAAKADRDSMAEKLATYQRNAAVQAAAAGKVSDPVLLNALLNQDAAFTDLDPNADNYADQVSAAVAAQIEAHPTLRAQAAASGVDTSTTNTGTDRKISLADLDTMSPQEIYDAGKAGKLNHLYK